MSTPSPYDGEQTQADGSSRPEPLPPQQQSPYGPLYLGTPPDRGGGWRKGCGITCCIVALLGAIGCVLVMTAARNARLNQHPRLDTWLGASMQAGRDTGCGQMIQRAIVEYHRDRGSYPSYLGQLYPAYIKRASIMHSAFDPNASPAHVSWTYARPPEGAPGDTPILYLPIEIPVGDAGPQASVVVFDLDGTTHQEDRRHRTFRWHPPGG